MAHKKAETAEEKPTAGIIMLPVAELHPHPQNPRHDLGDITELAANIKENGIRQNLTVNAEPDGSYTVIIGHRRLAAAKEAGLSEVPCAVVRMDKQKQLATMLEENLHRSDLTLSDKVRGFEQLRLSGMETAAIVKTTGFSKRSVERHFAYADKIGADVIARAEKAAKSNNRQVTLDELDRLVTIKDDERRAELAADLGTQNFGYRYQRAHEDEQNAEQFAEFREMMSDFGIPEIELSGFRGSEYADYNVYDRATLSYGSILRAPHDTFAQVCETLSITVPEDDIHWVDNGGAWGYLIFPLRDRTKKAEARAAREREDAERRERHKKIESAAEAAFRSRFEYVMKGDPTFTYWDLLDFLAFAAQKGDFDSDLFEKLTGLDLEELDDDKNLFWDYYNDKFCGSKRDENEFCKELFRLAYAMWGDDPYPSCNWEGSFRKDESLNRLYDYLEVFDYEMSDEEQALIDGTSPLYLHEPEDEEDDDEED